MITWWMKLHVERNLPLGPDSLLFDKWHTFRADCSGSNLFLCICAFNILNVGVESSQRFVNMSKSADVATTEARVKLFNTRLVARPSLNGDRLVARWSQSRDGRSTDYNRSGMCMLLLATLSTNPITGCITTMYL